MAINLPISPALNILCDSPMSEFLNSLAISRASGTSKVVVIFSMFPIYHHFAYIVMFTVIVHQINYQCYCNAIKEESQEKY